jgi:hypothetical protein
MFQQFPYPIYKFVAAGGKMFFSTPKVRIFFEANPASYSVGAEVIFWGKAGRGVKMVTHTHLGQECVKVYF